MEFERKFFVFLTRIFRWGCQNRTLCDSEIFFTKHRVLKKYILLKSLSVFRRQFSRFESKKFSQVYQFCIQFVWRKFSRESFAGNKLSLMAFFRIFTLFTFLWIYADFIGSVVKTELYVSTGLSSWEDFSLKKTF